MPWVDLQHADGTGPLDESFDAILVNAGVTHPRDAWLDALSEGGRIVMPLTASMAGNIGKGLMVLATRTASTDVFDARLLTLVAIFSAIGLRDAALNAELAHALAKRPFGPIARLRRDPHDRSDSCWFHTAAFCVASA
jgi:protein-L-isoaspartate(D-aspartate) O-methyltransferase